ncbi:MAG: protein-glutamate O-methyltransferase CheR [Lachnospiraceae bacterium]|jgi:chemotaxis protein methyltransferase CheR|nr:protein-glutamate O-methyltransferase CheR [Lachnospiraceae bacterium]RKI84583.1 protein-glutamate O-methyltransferase CheR [bacterium 1xD42-87]
MITDGEFQRIVTYVKQHYGIDLSQKRVLVGGRLENYLVRNGYANYNELMAKVEHNPKGSEATDLVNILTTNHTYFMRESEHFDFMKDVALPWAKDKTMGTKDLRVWCGASSTGEEPYTLAMIINDFFGINHSGWDTRLLATDISMKVLSHASKGVYLKEDIDPLPVNWKRHYFKQISQEEFKVKDELKREVIFKQFNLMDPITFKKKFHIVFLRNVMIYFQDDIKYPLINRIYDHMEPGGYLFIGLTERLDRQMVKFNYVQPSIYRK